MAPTHKTSRRIQVLVGEHTQSQMQLTLEPHHRITVTLYYVSLDKVLSELEVRFNGNNQEILCALRDMCAYPCSDTSYILFCRTIIQRATQIENRPPQHGATECQ